MKKLYIVSVRKGNNRFILEIDGYTGEIIDESSEMIEINDEEIDNESEDEEDNED